MEHIIEQLTLLLDDDLLHSDKGVADIIRGNRGILLANENSMIDTERIDREESGLVCYQSVNLEKHTGNPEVLQLIDLMRSNTQAAFFPGTVLRDYGHFVLPVMPVIINGTLECERVKQTGLAYVDDYSALAARFFGQDYAEKIKGFSGLFCDEPMKTLQDRLKAEVDQLRENSLRPFSYNGATILPILCNELSLIPNLYKGKPINLVLHSSSCMFTSEDERATRYATFFRQMKEKGLVEDPALLAVAEMGGTVEFAGIHTYEPFKGIFVYEKGQLRKVDHS